MALLLNKELVTNGVAPTDLTGWSQSPGTQWSIVSNKFQGAGNGGNNYLTQDFGAVLGREYKFSYDVTDNSLVGGTTANQIVLSGTGSFGGKSLSSAVGTHTHYLTVRVEASTNNQLRLLLGGNANSGTIDIDNISIKEYMPAELSRTGQHFSSHQEN